MGFIVPGSEIGVSGKNVGDPNHSLEFTIPLLGSVPVFGVSAHTGAKLTPGVLLCPRPAPRTSCTSRPRLCRQLVRETRSTPSSSTVSA